MSGLLLTWSENWGISIYTKKDGSRNGQKVAIIEDDAIGGGCNNWGTIPSKALRQLSREIWHNNKHYDFPEMLDTSFEIVLKQREIKKAKDQNEKEI